VRARIDLISGFEPAHAAADTNHGSREIVPEDEGQLVRQNLLERTGADLLVQFVQAGSLHADEYVVLPHRRLGHVGLLQGPLVLRNNERSHDSNSLS